MDYLLAYYNHATAFDPVQWKGVPRTPLQRLGNRHRHRKIRASLGTHRRELGPSLRRRACSDVTEVIPYDHEVVLLAEER